MKKLTAILLTLFFAAGAFAAGAKPWSQKAQLSYLSANGNTKSTTLGASTLWTMVKGKWTLELPAGGLNTSTQGTRTAEQYYAGEKIEFKLGERNYTFEKFLWERNTFAGFAHRYDVSAGLGREWWKTENNSLLTELGGGYINEQRIAAERNKFASGRAYSKYVRRLSATADFSQDAEYLHSFKENKDYRFNAESALISALSTHLSLKVSYGLKFRNLPPVGFTKTDTLTSISLIINY